MIERSFVCTIISYVRLLYCMNMYARFGGLTRPRDTSGIDAMFEGTPEFLFFLFVFELRTPGLDKKLACEGRMGSD